MTRKQIEQVALDYLQDNLWLTASRQYEVEQLADVIQKQVNAAIEEAARVAERSWGEPQTSASIRRLKI